MIVLSWHCGYLYSDLHDSSCAVLAAPLDQSYLFHLLHGLDRLVHQLSVVLNWLVSLPFHFKGGILYDMHATLAYTFVKNSSCRCLQSKQKSHTSANSLPASFLYAFVHLTFLGFLFILKFLWHLLRQKLNTYSQDGVLISNAF